MRHATVGLSISTPENGATLLDERTAEAMGELFYALISKVGDIYLRG